MRPAIVSEESSFLPHHDLEDTCTPDPRRKSEAEVWNKSSNV